MHLFTASRLLQDPLDIITCSCASLRVPFDFRCTCMINYKTRMLL